MGYRIDTGIEGSIIYVRDRIFDLVRLSDSATLLRFEKVINDSLADIKASAGAFLCPQGSATLEGLKKLVEKDWAPEEPIPAVMLIGC